MLLGCKYGCGPFLLSALQLGVNRGPVALLSLSLITSLPAGLFIARVPQHVAGAFVRETDPAGTQSLSRKMQLFLTLTDVLLALDFPL